MVAGPLFPVTGLPGQVAEATLKAVDEKGSPIPVSQGGFSLTCQFNPTELKIEKEISWVTYEFGKAKAGVAPTAGRNAPDLDFGGGEPAKFSLDLLFDTTHETSGSARDVRQYTNQLLKLTMMRKKRSGGGGNKPLAPPLVEFSWGTFQLFLAVITKVEITYRLFDSSGVPVRAKAKVNFLQADDRDDKELYGVPQNPTTRTEARKTRVVQIGERLDLIAYQEYGHPSYWRHLAEANNMLDPTDLRPGQILAITPLL